MIKKKFKTDFDCLEYKYMVQEKIYNDIKNFNWEHEVAYFNENAKKGAFKDLVNQFNSIEVRKF